MGSYREALLKLQEERNKVSEENKRTDAAAKESNAEYAALCEKATELGLKLVKGTVRRKSPSELNELKALLHETEEKKAQFVPEKKYFCNVCKDAGDTSCICFKKIHTDILTKNQTSLNTEISFDDFRLDCYPDSEYMGKVLNHCKTFADMVPDKNVANMIFTGKTGLGKTFMCSCMANRALERGISVLFIKASELFDEITFKGNEELRREVEQTRLLIIDDIGAERQTDMRYSDFLDILDKRNSLHEKYGYATVFTTNLDPKGLLAYYGERISSRLFGQYEIIGFKGEDIRLK